MYVYNFGLGVKVSVRILPLLLRGEGRVGTFNSDIFSIGFSGSLCDPMQQNWEPSLGSGYIVVRARLNLYVFVVHKRMLLRKLLAWLVSHADITLFKHSCSLTFFYTTKSYVFSCRSLPPFLAFMRAQCETWRENETHELVLKHHQPYWAVALINWMTNESTPKSYILDRARLISKHGIIHER